ncbi:outer membrane protein [Sphingoaurantiacus capsulatus]|uniref:Outer membrane protein n=1 Tax=Sphingoaurantiacus capsulatus TaxID=1771310 RepID=A0ABV7XBX4_9SPHN
MKKILLAAVLVAGTAMPAMAQDASWTGGYVGGRIGYAFQPNNGDETIVFDRNLDGTFGDTISTAAAPTGNAFSPGFCGGAATSTAPGTGCTKDKDGLDIAVHAGFDYQFEGGFVVGLVADYGTQKGRDSVAAFSTTPAFYTMTRRLRDNYSIRARAGFGTDQFLVYGTGGWAWGKVKNSFSTSNTANSFTTNGNDTADGYRLGVGTEYRLGTNVTVGVQYLYTRLDDDGYRVRAGNTGTTPATNPFLLGNAAGTDFARSEDKLTSNSLAATVNFRF